MHICILLLSFWLKSLDWFPCFFFVFVFFFFAFFYHWCPCPKKSNDVLHLTTAVPSTIKWKCWCIWPCCLSPFSFLFPLFFYSVCGHVLFWILTVEVLSFPSGCRLRNFPTAPRLDIHCLAIICKDSPERRKTFSFPLSPHPPTITTPLPHQPSSTQGITNVFGAVCLSIFFCFRISSFSFCYFGFNCMNSFYLFYLKSIDRKNDLCLIVTLHHCCICIS